MALVDDLGTAVNPAHAAAGTEHCGKGAETHGAAEIAALAAALDLVATRPLGQQTDDREFARAELRRTRSFEPDQIADRLDHRHLHAEADAEERHLVLAREASREDLALRAAFTEPAGDQDAVDILQAVKAV